MNCRALSRLDGACDHLYYGEKVSFPNQLLRSRTWRREMPGLQGTSKGLFNHINVSIRLHGEGNQNPAHERRENQQKEGETSYSLENQ